MEICLERWKLLRGFWNFVFQLIEFGLNYIGLTPNEYTVICDDCEEGNDVIK